MTKLQMLLQEMANRLEKSMVKSLSPLKLSARNLQTENTCIPIIPQEGHNVDLTHKVNESVEYETQTHHSGKKIQLLLTWLQL